MLDTFVIALLVSAAALVVIRPLAPRIGLMDHPADRRRTHTRAVPLIGGIAVFSGVTAAMLLGDLRLDDSVVWGALGATLLVVVGALDDRSPLNVRVRIGAQLAAALLLVLGTGAQLHSLGNLLGTGPILLGAAGIPLTLFAVIGLINAFNMIDGIDGLAGGLALIALAAVLVATGGQGTLAGVLAAVIAALVPYLIANLELFGCGRFKVFLGDAGSTLLGYLVAWSLIEASQGPSATLAPVTAIWLTAIPLLDTLTVMARRMATGQSPFAADRGHLHHVLMRLRGCKRVTLVALLIAAVACALFGLLGQALGIGEPVMFAAALATLAAVLLLRRNTRKAYLRVLRRRRDEAATEVA